MIFRQQISIWLKRRKRRGLKKLKQVSYNQCQSKFKIEKAAAEGESVAKSEKKGEGKFVQSNIIKYHRF